jgi:hypothetical protein
MTLPIQCHTATQTYVDGEHVLPGSMLRLVIPLSDWLLVTKTKAWHHTVLTGQDSRSPIRKEPVSMQAKLNSRTNDVGTCGISEYSNSSRESCQARCCQRRTSSESRVHDALRGPQYIPGGRGRVCRQFKVRTYRSYHLSEIANPVMWIRRLSQSRATFKHGSNILIEMCCQLPGPCFGRAADKGPKI